MRTINIPGTSVTDTPGPAPALVLPDRGTPGVLGLWRPGHPGSGKTLVPATGENFNDIAADWTKLTLGLAEAPGWRVNNTINNAQNQAFVERSAKGGVFVANAHSGATGSPYQNFSIAWGADRQANIGARAAAGDVFYTSGWIRLTRPPRTGTTGFVTGGFRKGTNLADFLAVFGWSGSMPWHWPQAGSADFVAARVEVHGNLAFVAVAAKKSGAFATNSNAVLMGAGNVNTLNILQSEGIYSFFGENITLSKRTFEQIANADYLEFRDELLTPSGMHYGDAWTEPTTKVP